MRGPEGVACCGDGDDAAPAAPAAPAAAPPPPLLSSWTLHTPRKAAKSPSMSAKLMSRTLPGEGASPERGCGKRPAAAERAHAESLSSSEKEVESEEEEEELAPAAVTSAPPLAPQRLAGSPCSCSWMSSTTLALNRSPRATDCSPTCKSVAPLAVRARQRFSARPGMKSPSLS